LSAASETVEPIASGESSPSESAEVESKSDEPIKGQEASQHGSTESPDSREDVEPIEKKSNDPSGSIDWLLVPDEETSPRGAELPPETANATRSDQSFSTAASLSETAEDPKSNSSGPVNSNSESVQEASQPVENVENNSSETVDSFPGNSEPIDKRLNISNKPEASEGADRSSENKQVISKDKDGVGSRISLETEFGSISENETSSLDRDGESNEADDGSSTVAHSSSVLDDSLSAIDAVGDDVVSNPNDGSSPANDNKSSVSNVSSTASEDNSSISEDISQVPAADYTSLPNPTGNLLADASSSSIGKDIKNSKAKVDSENTENNLVEETSSSPISEIESATKTQDEDRKPVLDSGTNQPIINQEKPLNKSPATYSVNEKTNTSHEKSVDGSPTSATGSEELIPQREDAADRTSASTSVIKESVKNPQDPGSGLPALEEDTKGTITSPEEATDGLSASILDTKVNDENQVESVDVPQISDSSGPMPSPEEFISSSIAPAVKQVELTKTPVEFVNESPNSDPQRPITPLELVADGSPAPSVELPEPINTFEQTPNGSSSPSVERTGPVETPEEFVDKLNAPPTDPAGSTSAPEDLSDVTSAPTLESSNPIETTKKIADGSPATSIPDEDSISDLTNKTIDPLTSPEDLWMLSVGSAASPLESSEQQREDEVSKHLEDVNIISPDNDEILPDNDDADMTTEAPAGTSKIAPANRPVISEDGSQWITPSISLDDNAELAPDSSVEIPFGPPPPPVRGNFHPPNPQLQAPPPLKTAAERLKEAQEMPGGPSDDVTLAVERAGVRGSERSASLQWMEDRVRKYSPDAERGDHGIKTRDSVKAETEKAARLAKYQDGPEIDPTTRVSPPTRARPDFNLYASSVLDHRLSFSPPPLRMIGEGRLAKLEPQDDPAAAVNQTEETPSQKQAARMWDGALLVDRVPTVFATFLVGRKLGRGLKLRTVYGMKSACLVHPGARIVVLSDHATDLSFLDAFKVLGVHDPLMPHATACPLHLHTKLKIGALHRDTLMRYRLQAEEQFLLDMAEKRLVQHVVFFDTDVLFVDRLDSLWEKKFDVAFTYHENRDAPLDLAVKYIRGTEGNMKSVANLWTEAIKAFQKECFTCDQAAFLQTLYSGVSEQARSEFWHKAAARYAFHINWDRPAWNNLDVVLLPCNEFNAMAGSDQMFTCEPIHNTKVLHFKGKLQALEPEYWREILEGRPKNALQMATKEAEDWMVKSSVHWKQTKSPDSYS